MKIKIDDSAVSEVIGAIFLLAIAVSVFAVIYMNVLSDTGPDPDIYSTIVGKVEGTGDSTDAIDVAFEHRRGEGININSRVSLLLEGIHSIQTTVANLLDSTSKNDGIWNIGEKLIYKPDPELIPNFFIDDIQIKGTITDIETNSLVFWGLLQEGYTVPPGGRGGIWHLDEGTGSIAIDSSGNNNHGNVHGSRWIPGKKNYALMFNSDSTDYVKVPNGPGLYITDEITVETWICPLDTTSGIIDSFDFDEHASGPTGTQELLLK